MELVSYAMDFVSFLMQNLKSNEKEKVRSVILFGSVARGEANKDSDVDIFIDVIDEKLDSSIKKIKNDYFNSVKYLKYWKLLNINNEINLIIGKLNEWKLKDSMLGNSYILYQGYSPKLENGTNKVILYYETPEKNSKRVMLNKQIFGYNHYSKFYKGILEIYNGKKLGSNVLLIPTENLNLFLKIFHKYKVAVRIKRIFEYNQ